jgi:peptidoglycan/xylan/chitin deacetylase (PgdA/CDA1 family)
MRLFRPLFLSQILYPRAIFRTRGDERILTLTFDDGPDPSTTTSILEKTGKYGVKAIFFCTGKSAKENPELIEKIKAGGHLIGNHSFSHPDGFKTCSKEYADDVERGAEFTSSVIFRPPYGRMTSAQYRILKRKYKIVMWDLMAWDFDPSFGKERMLKKMAEKVRPGSVIVFHDTAESSAVIVIEDFIKDSLKQGYRFEIPAELV